MIPGLGRRPGEGNGYLLQDSGLENLMDYTVHGPAEPPGKLKSSEVGSLSLLQQVFTTQESNWGLLHCRWILYQLSYQGRQFCPKEKLNLGQNLNILKGSYGKFVGKEP